MRVLVPIDGSDCSRRALDFGIGFAEKYEAELQVVHFTDHPTEATDKLMQRAREFLEEQGVTKDIDVMYDVRKFRASDRVGKNILEVSENRGIDHIVMGHHGTGALGRAVLGSAAETVVRGAEQPVTIIP